MPETRIRFMERPSLAVLGDKLTKKFGVHIVARRTAEGLELTIDGELTDQQKQKLEAIMAEMGYLEEED